MPCVNRFAVHQHQLVMKAVLFVERTRSGKAIRLTCPCGHVYDRRLRVEISVYRGRV
jgi:hypothetical protein